MRVFNLISANLDIVNYKAKVIPIKLKNTKIAGNRAEDFAAQHLIDSGYIIVHRNWRYKRFELDIIATKGTTICFIEVKYRSNEGAIKATSAIKLQQEKRIMAAANAYIQANEVDFEVRFDVIAVSDQKNELLLTHIKNAFSPTLD